MSPTRTMAEKESHITSASSPCTVVASAIPRYLRREASFEDTNAVYPSSPLVSRECGSLRGAHSPAALDAEAPLESCNGPNPGSSTRSLPALGATVAPSQTTAVAQDVQRLRQDVSELKAQMRQVDERLERTEEILQERPAQKKRKRRFFRSLVFRRR